jgi:S-adenosylmethionine decarboxylase
MHLIIEFYGCSPEIINDQQFMLNTMNLAAEAAGCEILHSYSHQFEPQGVTVIVVVSESHLSCHTYPELGYAALDVFTCGPLAMPEKALDVLKRLISPKKTVVVANTRGSTPSKREKWSLEEIYLSSPPKIWPPSW